MNNRITLALHLSPDKVDDLVKVLVRPAEFPPCLVVPHLCLLGLDAGEGVAVPSVEMRLFAEVA
jgi:hypothetical protein